MFAFTEPIASFSFAAPQTPRPAPRPRSDLPAPCSRPVRLHIAHLPGLDPRPPMRLAQTRLLRETVRHRQTARRPCPGSPPSQESPPAHGHRLLPHPEVASAATPRNPRLAQSHPRSHPTAAHTPRGENMPAGQRRTGFRAENQIDSARQRGGAFAALQSLACKYEPQQEKRSRQCPQKEQDHSAQARKRFGPLRHLRRCPPQNTDRFDRGAGDASANRA